MDGSAHRSRVLVVDHVILKGGYFVLAHYFWPAEVEGKGLLAAGGVLVSFAMFLPLAMMSSWAGFVDAVGVPKESLRRTVPTDAAPHRLCKGRRAALLTDASRLLRRAYGAAKRGR